MAVGVTGELRNNPVRVRRHILVGVAAGALLLLIYAGIITVAQGWQHLLEQTATLWYGIVILAIGFGIQAGLFSFIRQSLRERKTSATASLATSGGISASSMVACCAHHVGDVLPLISIAGVTAFVVRYQPLFIILGVLSNMLGISLMLGTIQRHGLCPWVTSWKWDMSRVTRGAMVLVGLVLVIAALITTLRTGQ